MRYVILGGGIAGVSAALTIRQHDNDGEITIYSDDFHPLGLYARKEMAERLALGDFEHDDLLLEDVDGFKARGIDFEYHPIEAIFPQTKQFMRQHMIRRSYDRLLLATGATPKIVDVPGTHYIGVHQARISEDFALIQAWLPELQTKGAVILGGGILALDMAYALTRRGVPVTMIVRDAHVGKPLLDETPARLIEDRMRADGVELLLGHTITSYHSTDDLILDGVILDDGRLIPARMALSAIGVRPRADVAVEAGIAVDEATGAIMVDTHMRTNTEHIYAAGNVASANGIIARNWSISAEQGRIAGLNMVGIDAAFSPVHELDPDARFYDLRYQDLLHAPVSSVR